MYQYLLLLLLSPFIYFRIQRKSKRAIIAVLGDYGHSPRMQNHTLMLLKMGFMVDVISYKGSNPLKEILNNSNCTFHYLNKPETLQKEGNKLSYLKKAFIRIFAQVAGIFRIVLFQIQRPQFIIVQNPPAIPTLFVFQICRLLMGVSFVIDWHNFGYSIMALSKGGNGKFVLIAKVYERVFGRMATLHLCVTNGMADLLKNWGFRGEIETLYDKPPSQFKPFNELDKAHYLAKVDFSNTQIELFDKPRESNTFSLLNKATGTYALRSNAPSILVSSTSWTEDEDFSVLFAALKMYEKEREANHTIPELYVIITGKGPQKEHYMNLVDKENFTHVKIFTAWVPIEDYPKLLACANLGVSLHSSSSGLDLPMKVVDMFGVGLPVLALGFKCLPELVQEGVNGYIFDSPKELFSKLIQILQSPENQNTLRRGALEFRKFTWGDAWLKSMQPFISKLAR